MALDSARGIMNCEFWIGHELQACTSGGITIEFEYANGGTRPTKVTYTATAPNGEKLSKEFENSH